MAPRLPLQAPARRKAFILPLERVHPFIRFVHQRTYTQGFELSARHIRSHSFFLNLQGVVTFRTAAQALTLPPFTLLYIQPFIPHILGSRPAEPHRHLSVNFDWAPAFPFPSPNPRSKVDQRPPYQVTLSPELTIPLYTQLTAGHPVIAWFEELLAVHHSGSATAPLEASVFLQRIILSLLRRSAKTPEGPRPLNWAKLQHALTYVEAHLHEPLSVTHVAAAAQVSVTHLTRLMATHLHTTPAEYLRQTRIHRARALLADLQLSIKEVAARTGFKSPYHFSRVFRQVDGLSPTQFRTAVAARTPSVK